MNDVPQQRGVRRLELLHRAVLPGLQGVDQLHILHNVSLLFLRMSYYTPEMAKSHKIFLEVVDTKRACPRSGEGGQALDTKDWKPTHIFGMFSAPSMREKRILYASILFLASNYCRGY